MPFLSAGLFFLASLLLNYAAFDWDSPDMGCANDRMLTAGTAAFTYDANGNTLMDNLGGVAKNYTWDFEDRLKALTKTV